MALNWLEDNLLYSKYKIKWHDDRRPASFVQITLLNFFLLYKKHNTAFTKRFLKNVTYAHQGCLYLINIKYVIYSCDGKLDFLADQGDSSTKNENSVINYPPSYRSNQTFVQN